MSQEQIQNGKKSARVDLDNANQIRYRQIVLKDAAHIDVELIEKRFFLKLDWDRVPTNLLE